MRLVGLLPKGTAKLADQLPRAARFIPLDAAEALAARPDRTGHAMSQRPVAVAVAVNVNVNAHDDVETATHAAVAQSFGGTSTEGTSSS